MASDQVRLDKWLWAARFFKTRSLATDAVSGGHVHVNGRRVKASRTVKLGDELTITKGQTEWTIVVRDLSERRGPASQAAKLYEETDESRSKRESRAAERREHEQTWVAPTSKPDKRERRRTRRIKYG